LTEAIEIVAERKGVRKEKMGPPYRLASLYAKNSMNNRHRSGTTYLKMSVSRKEVVFLIVSALYKYTNKRLEVFFHFFDFIQ
jgi:hypothetical protein